MQKFVCWLVSACAAASIGCAAAETAGSSVSTSGRQFRLTTPEQRAAFQRDGYVVIRGVLSEEEIQELAAAGKDAANDGALSKGYSGNVQTSRVALTPSGFQQVALYSDIPAVVAELMQLDPATQTLRLIHDFFFSRNLQDVVRCDWHVDGHGLWPESFETPSKASQASGVDQDGINAWISMDDMPVEFEGSMAVSAGSHRAPWRYDAMRAMGRDGTSNGGKTWEKYVADGASGTGMVAHPDGPRIRLCALGVTAPDLYEKCEAEKRILDLKAGDVVFASRNLFHRTLQLTDAGRKHFDKMGQTHLNRYTIRYTVGSAELVSGYCWLEWSIILNPSLAGLTLDEATKKEPTYWFPKVWPSRPDDFEERLKAVVPQVEVAKKKYEEVQNKLFAEIAAAKAAKEEESKKQPSSEF